MSAFSIFLDNYVGYDFGPLIGVIIRVATLAGKADILFQTCGCKGKKS